MRVKGCVALNGAEDLGVTPVSLIDREEEEDGTVSHAARKTEDKAAKATRGNNVFIGRT